MYLKLVQKPSILDLDLHRSGHMICHLLEPGDGIRFRQNGHALVHASAELRSVATRFWKQ